MHNIIRNNYTPHIGDYHNTIVHDNELNRVWFFDCDGVFESKTNIAVRNEGGESTTDAISQKFVTDNLNNINEDIDELEVGKQNKLVSGTNIKTINNQSVLGSGDIHIEGASDNYEDLNNLPKVNNTTLIGNKTSADLGLQPALTAGDNITIENNVISAEVPSLAWGSMTGDIADQTDLQSALDNKQNVITAGNNLSFSGNTLNAVDTTYTAGTNITIDSNNVISATAPSSAWGSMTGYIFDQTDLFEALKGKQGELTAGNNITIAKPTFKITYSGSRMGVIMNAIIGEPLDGLPRGSSSTGHKLTIADRSVLGTVHTIESGIGYDTLIPLKAGTTTVQYGIPGSTQEEISFTLEPLLRSYVISAAALSPTWGSITGNLSNQPDLQNALDDKQNTITAGTNLSFNGDTLNAVDTTYTAGTNITIDSNNVISATGGGTSIEAGKGIEVEEYAPLSITMEVTGELPPDFEDILPVSISLTNIKPGTNMYDLYLEGVIADDKMFSWDTLYTMSTSGIDEDVISIAETDNALYVIQFNGAGTTTGTITATRGAESYTANVTATITAGDNASYVSKGRYQFPVGVLMAAIEMSFGDKIEDPEELLEIFQGQDNVDALIDAIKKGYEFYGSADGITINFQALMYDEYGIVLLMQSGGDFDSAIISIRIEDGEVSSLSKDEVISTFTEDSDGLVPKPGSSQAGSKYLKGNGTWQTLNTYALTLTLEDDTTVTLNLKGE